MNQLHEIFKIMLAYKDAVDGLYGYSVAEFTRRQERGARIEARTKKGQWGVRETDEEGDSHAGGTPGRWGGGEDAGDTMLPSLRLRLKALSGDFQARVVILLGDLAYQSDMDMRLLGVLLSFNEYVFSVGNCGLWLTNKDTIRLSIREQGGGIEGERLDLKLEREGKMILGLGMKLKHDTFFYLRVVWASRYQGLIWYLWI